MVRSVANFFKLKNLFFFSLDTPINKNQVRFVCISDTHDKLDELLNDIPNGDVLLHCGDFTNFGELDEIQRFNQQIGSGFLFFFLTNF